MLNCIKGTLVDIHGEISIQCPQIKLDSYAGWNRLPANIFLFKKKPGETWIDHSHSNQIALEKTGALLKKCRMLKNGHKISELFLLVVLCSDSQSKLNELSYKNNRELPPNPLYLAIAMKNCNHKNGDCFNEF